MSLVVATHRVGHRSVVGKWSGGLRSGGVECVLLGSFGFLSTENNFRGKLLQDQIHKLGGKADPALLRPFRRDVAAVGGRG